MTQLRKALLSLIQDGQKGIPPCYGDKSLCSPRAKDKRRRYIFAFYMWQNCTYFSKLFYIVGNSNCYQIWEKTVCKLEPKFKMAVFPLSKTGSGLVWKWLQCAIAFSKGFMRRQRTDKCSLLLVINWFLIQGLNVQLCTAKESTIKVFDADIHDFFVPRCLALLTCLQSISLLAFPIMEILKVIFLYFSFD